jgi:ribosome silencing factor RsfS/YbeB/iojap
MTRVRRALASLAGRAACASASARELGHSVPERALRRLGCLNLRSSRGATSPLREFGAATTPASRKALGHATRWEIRPATGTSWCPAGPVRGVASSSGSRRAAEDESASHGARVATSRLGAEEAESSTSPSTAVDISDANDPSLRFYGAPADYAGVTVRSSINWPLPLDEIAKLNPKLALAMGASEARVAENNKRRPKLDAVTSGRGGKHSASATNRYADDVVDSSVVDPEEARVLASLWEEDRRDAEERDTELDAFRTKRAHEKQSEIEKRDAQLSGRKNAPYAPRAVGADAVRKAREEADAQLARVERDAARKLLAEKWEAAVKNGDVSSLLPKPGSKPGVTPRVYNALKKQMLRKSDRATMAKHVSSELSAAALRRLKVADLRRACDVVGVPSVGDKKLLVEMLKAHFDDAERLFAREFVEKIVDLDKEVAARKGRARRMAEAERRKQKRTPAPARPDAGARTEGAAAAAAARASAAAAAGAAAREGTTGKRRIGERASARAARAAARLRGWDDDDAEAADVDADADSLEGLEGLEDLSEDLLESDLLEDDEDEEEEEEEDASEDDGDDLTPTSSGRMKYASAFEPEELVSLLLKAKGADVVSIPVRERCGWADHFVIATARSPRHIRMLAGAVLHAVKQRVSYVVGTTLRPSIEGADSLETGEQGDDHWMLVDCGSCVVHVFSSEARERYDLEGLWAPGVSLPRRNPKEDATMTIDTIRVFADDDDFGRDANDDEGVPHDGVLRDSRRAGDAVALDLASMRDLDAYDDEYLEPPDWDKSLTDLEEARVKRHGRETRRSSKTECSFGKKGVALDDEGE